MPPGGFINDVYFCSINPYKAGRMAFFSYLTVSPRQDEPRRCDGHLTNLPIRNMDARVSGGRGSSPQKGGAMSSDNAVLSLQEMEERFDLLAQDATEYAVFLVGLEGHLLCWNAGAERMFGYQSDEVVGQHFSRFFSPEDLLTGQPEY
jgi:PAS domain-containing protein